jgi:hypothetical protein
MTAAFEHLCGPALRARGARLLGALALLLPIPTMAALGLSLPLPATVERLAAKLVPFGDADALDPDAAHPAAHGSIVLAPGEQAAESPVSSTTPKSELALRRSRVGAQKGDGRAQPTPDASDTGNRASSESEAAGAARTNTQNSGADVSSPASSGGSGTTTTTTPTTGDTSPAPTPSPVDTATSTTNGAVATATNTATTATDTATKAADSAATTVSDNVGGIKPP